MCGRDGGAPEAPDFGPGSGTDTDTGTSGTMRRAAGVSEAIPDHQKPSFIPLFGYGLIYLLAFDELECTTHTRMGFRYICISASPGYS